MPHGKGLALPGSSVPPMQRSWAAEGSVPPLGLPVTASAWGASGVLLVFFPSQLVFTRPLLTF